LLVEREVPGGYIEAASLSTAEVYLNPEMDDALEAEGYAREVMRRVQSMRKDAGLQKTDDIVLHIQRDEDLELFDEWEKQIAQKCGASKIRIDVAGPAKKHKHTETVKIKDFEFSLSFDKNTKVPASETTIERTNNVANVLFEISSDIG